MQDIDHLLLSRSECFREVMEQKELIERALATKDHEIMDLFSTTLKPVGPDKDLFMEVRQPSRDPYATLSHHSYFSFFFIIMFYYLICYHNSKLRISPLYIFSHCKLIFTQDGGDRKTGRYKE